MVNKIPFHKPYVSPDLEKALAEVIRSGVAEGNGPNSRLCEEEIGRVLGSKRILLTTSCTSALEMAVLLSGIGPGDEVIVPSFTFVATASAVCRSGAIPVFVDIDPETLCIDLTQVEAAITDRTKAILPVHYAGISCDMSELKVLANGYGLKIIEDAAQAFLGKYEDSYLGAIGDFGCFSFHNTKVFSSGEGGALVVNNAADWEKATVWRDVGTNRQDFLDGNVDKYSWIGDGTNISMPELSAAMLLTQIRSRDDILSKRKYLFERYLDCLSGLFKVPKIPEYNEINFHFFYVMMQEASQAKELIAFLEERGIQAVQHYPPLHKSTYVKKSDNIISPHLPISDTTASNIVRLPLFTDMLVQEQDRVISAMREFSKNVLRK